MRKLYWTGALTVLLGIAAVGALAEERAPRLMAHLPKDPLLTAVTDVGNLEQTLNDLAAWIGKFDTDLDTEELESDLEELEAEVGCSVRSAILAQIGPELGFSFDLPPVDELMAGMGDPAAAVPQAFGGTGLVATIRDAAVLDSCLRKLAVRFELEVRERGELVHLVAAGEPAAPSPMPLPQELGFFYGIRDGVAAFSASERFVRASLTPRPTGEALVDGADFARVFRNLDRAPAKLSYVNLPKLRMRIEESGMLQGLLGSQPQTATLADLLLSDKLTAIGFGSTSVRVDGGLRTTTFSPPGLSAGTAYLGIVAAVVIPRMVDATEKAKRLRTAADLRTLGVALESYRVDRDAYPGPTDGWVEIGTIADQLEPTYLAGAPRADAWDHPFLYWSDGASYRLVSYGGDGTPDRDWSAVSLTDGEPDAESGSDLVYSDGRFVIAVPAE